MAHCANKKKTKANKKAQAVPLKKKWHHATDEQKAEVLKVYDNGGEWLKRAYEFGISRSSAYDLIRNCDKPPQRWGRLWQKTVKLTDDILKYIMECLQYEPDLTMKLLQEKVKQHYNVNLGISTIYDAVRDEVFTVKTTRFEKEAMNNPDNIELRFQYANKLQEHIAINNFIVYVDETNFNLYLKRNQSWSHAGAWSVIRVPGSQGKNIQIQLAVNAQQGVAFHQVEHGSITKSISSSKATG